MVQWSIRTYGTMAQWFIREKGKVQWLVEHYDVWLVQAYGAIA